MRSNGVLPSRERDLVPGPHSWAWTDPLTRTDFAPMFSPIIIAEELAASRPASRSCRAGRTPPCCTQRATSQGGL
jgi:hypothetical protein